ncbi:hypothetical protein GCM10020295_21690 [Streptomyces cinereospinus]
MITARAAASFEPVGRSVASARSFVRDTLQGWGCADIVDDAVVLTSELVTNAVVHAGTTADVLCLRLDGGVRIEVADHYPEREVPLQGAAVTMTSPDREGGRGLQLCAALAGRWGVDYTPTHKQVWFRLDLPERAVGTRTAGPSLPADLLPLADGRVRVAVIQIDRTGSITAWNDDAEELFGYQGEQVTGKPLTDLAAWPHTPGTGTGIAEALQLSRWEGSYGIRDADGRVVPVYASHLRVRDTAGEPSTVCLLVRDHERAVLQTPTRITASDTAASSEGKSTDPFEVFIGSPAPDDLDGLLQRTVERARDMLDGDSAFLLLATDDETELEVRASTGLPSARQRFARVPVEAGPGRYGSARMPAVHDDLTAVPGAVPLLHGTGMRSVVTVPPQGRGPPHRLPRRRRRGPPADTRTRRRCACSSPPTASPWPSSPPASANSNGCAALPELPRRGLRPARRHPGPRPDARPDGPDDGPDPRHLVRRLHDRRPGLGALPLLRPARGRGTHRRHQVVAVEDPPARPGPHPRRPRLVGSGRDGPPGRPAHLDAQPGPGRTRHGQLRHRYDPGDGVRGRRRDGRAAPGRPQPRHRHAHPWASPPTSTSARRSWNWPRTCPAGRPWPWTTPASTPNARPSASPSSAASCPPELPQIKGVEVEVIYRAAGEGNEVGGDFYDIFPIHDGAYGFAIGDVCGTGPNAAAVTGLARHALRLLAREGLSGPAVLQRLNSAILDEGARSRFLTLLYGEMRPQEDGSAELKVVCAGHPLPLRLRPDGTVEAAAEPQPLLGVLEDLDLYEQTVTLDPGDVLLCVTDGVTERREGNRMLGDDGLADVLTTCTGLTAGAVAARIMRAVERFASDAPSDDMAILAMRVPGLHPA